MLRASKSALFLLLAGCSGRAAPPLATDPIQRVVRSVDVYDSLGFMTGTEDFPAVANIEALDGPQDSTFLIVSMSLPNSALTFQRAASGLVAAYTVQASFIRDSVTIKRIDRRENVRAENSDETSSSAPTIVFQQVISVTPGRYVVDFQAKDVNSTRGFRAIDTIVAPAFPAQQPNSRPILISQGNGRSNTDTPPPLVVNPRNSVSHEGLLPRIYIEQYGAETPQPLPIRVVDDSGAVVWSDVAKMNVGNQEVRYSMVELPPKILSLQRAWIQAGDTTENAERTPLVINSAEQWVITDIGRMLELLRYIAYNSEVDSLRKASDSEREELWERFWARRDPSPNLAGNEAREQFFERIRIATRELREAGQPGWTTDRGEVYIVLGPPSYEYERYVGRSMTAQPNLIEWLYNDATFGSMVLQFYDRTGFGRYELTQSSRASFMSAAHRLRPR